MKKSAIIISRVFEPMVVGGMLLMLAFYRVGMNPLFAILFIVPVALMRFWFVKIENLDWDIKDRKKRIVPLSILLVFISGYTLFVSLWQNTFLTDLFVFFLVWGIGYFAITLFWKISGHTSVLTLVGVLTLEWYGTSVWPILLAIPLVAWARVVTKNHTIGQVIGGIVYSFGFLAFAQYEVWQSVLG